jgi:GT2 family glycosyltransferase
MGFLSRFGRKRDRSFRWSHRIGGEGGGRESVLSPPAENALGPLYVFILSYNRPIYLWVTLDSLARATKRRDVRFVIQDNCSTDARTRDVIASFERRGVFHRVILSPTNDPQAVNHWLEEIGDGLGEFFGFVESDVYVYAHDYCWLDRMLVSMLADPKLAMLGSQIDKSDFVPLERSSRSDRPLGRRAAELIKANSPERLSPSLGFGELGSPHNPPGRLTLLRSAAIRRTGFAADKLLAKRLEELGYRTAITGSVAHRHLSLLHVFDEPDYDFEQRDAFMSAIDRS